MIDREALAEKYTNAWNCRDATLLLSMLHPRASYYDALWGEACTGPDLRKYILAEVAADPYWYRLDGKVIPTRNGLVARYIAFHRSDEAGIQPVFNGADILTVSGRLIVAISEHYCDPSPTELAEIATRMDQRHDRSDPMKSGLSSRRSVFIKNRLRELARTTNIYLDPSLSVTKLADNVGCTVMHLFRVIEEQMNTTFLNYVNEWRSRHAGTLLVNFQDSEPSLEVVAKDCGFESISAFREAFIKTFGIEPEEYSAKFARASTGSSRSPGVY